jgi:hypothetical protein
MAASHTVLMSALPYFRAPPSAAAPDRPGSKPRQASQAFDAHHCKPTIGAHQFYGGGAGPELEGTVQRGRRPPVLVSAVHGDPQFQVVGLIWGGASSNRRGFHLPSVKPPPRPTCSQLLGPRPINPSIHRNTPICPVINNHSRKSSHLGTGSAHAAFPPPPPPTFRHRASRTCRPAKATYLPTELLPLHVCRGCTTRHGGCAGSRTRRIRATRPSKSIFPDETGGGYMCHAMARPPRRQHDPVTGLFWLLCLDGRQVSRQKAALGTSILMCVGVLMLNSMQGKGSTCRFCA